MSKNEQISYELKRIADNNKGVLRPKKVVEIAKNPKNILHNCFEWDNSKAGAAYRLWQARQLISVHVEYITSTNEPSRVFVSLSKDRISGGYRQIIDVLQDKNLRKMMLQDALREMEYFTQKYQQLVELRDVFVAIRKIKKKIKY